MYKISAFFSLIGLIYSQTIPSFDFSTIPPLGTPPSPCITPTSLTSSTSCSSQSTMFSYCCQMTPLSGTGSFCASVSPQAILPSMKTYTLNNTSYNVQCNINEGVTGSPCGVLSPKTYTDCTKYSTTSNSCCYYTSSTLNVNYCFWIGMYLPVSPVASVQCNPPPTTTTDASMFSFTWTLLAILFTFLLAF